MHVIYWLHAHEWTSKYRMKENSAQEEHKTPPHVKIGKMYYSVRWFLKMLSTSRVIVLQLLWFSTPAEVTSLYGEEGHMRSHPMECQHTSCTLHTYCSGTLRPLPWTEAALECLGEHGTHMQEEGCGLGVVKEQVKWVGLTWSKLCAFTCTIILF